MTNLQLKFLIFVDFGPISSHFRAIYKQLFRTIKRKMTNCRPKTVTFDCELYAILYDNPIFESKQRVLTGFDGFRAQNLYRLENLIVRLLFIVIIRNIDIFCQKAALFEIMVTSCLSVPTQKHQFTSV